MNPFHQYLESLLAEHLKKCQVVVWYDPRQEFLPFMDSLLALEKLENEISRVVVDGMDVSLARFKGSFFGLKDAIEPIVAVDQPEPLVLYLPGVIPG